MRETAVVFGRSSALVGVITDPPGDRPGADGPGVILLNAGLLHRIGPNRLYVEMARALAAQGCVAFRFDFSGIGDSDVRRDSLPFEQSIVSEVQEAMDFLGRERGTERFILMGLCAGALSAFNTARVDARVVGTVLINPQGYDEDVTSRASARRYWKKVVRVLIDPRRWARAMLHRASPHRMLAELRRLMSAAPSAGDLRGEFEALVARGVEIFVIFSSAQQRGVTELETILGGRVGRLLHSGRLRIETAGDASHTFGELRHQAQLLAAVGEWVAKTFTPRAAHPPPAAPRVRAG